MNAVSIAVLVAQALAQGEPAPATPAAPEGMVWIPAGELAMGSDDARALRDERPVHRVELSGFFIDATEVTNAQFRAFVETTGYVTTAERAPDVKALLEQLPPGSPPPDKELLVPGSLVFEARTDGQWWWKWKPGASWRKPDGEHELDARRDKHPVVHVSWDDAVAYAKWAQKRLPTEAEWEYAARGGLAKKVYAWGDVKEPGGAQLANIWQGQFPLENTLADGFSATAPVASFKPNGYGLYDMSGNVWEWCADWYRADWYARKEASARDTTGPTDSFDPAEPHAQKRVNRGGSFLCSDVYCIGYRPSARMKSTPDTSLVHTGFRCVVTPAMLAARAKAK